MLDYAKKHEDKLKALWCECAFNPYYKYVSLGPIHYDIKLPDSTEYQHDFVSVYEGELIGYISYNINRITGGVYNLCVLHFGGDNGKHKYIFGRDVITALQDVFVKYQFNKISFSVIIGNPALSMFERIVKYYGGSVVGIMRSECRLYDSNMYDVKLFEILSYQFRNRKIRVVVKSAEGIG
jgi:hypothetical protein